MKKALLTTALFLTAIVVVQAQTDSKKFDIGARGGINLTTITGDGFDSPDARTSFYAGLVAEMPIIDRFSLQLEAFYSGQGFNIESNDNSDDIEFQVDYIQVPLLAKIYLIEGLNIQGGAQIGFKINEEIDSAPTDDGGDFDTDTINDYDFNVTAGVEYKFSNGFFVQARYTYGLSEVIEDVDAHNAVFSTGIGFMF